MSPIFQKSEFQDVDDIVDVELSDTDEIPILDRFKIYQEINAPTSTKKKRRRTANKTPKPKTEPSHKPKTPTAKRNDNETTSTTTTTTTLESSVNEVNARLMAGCECQGSCYRDLQADSVYRHRLNIAELTKQEHDMYLMGVTMACLANRTETNRHKERIRQRASYVFQGKRVCLDAFLYLENVTHYHLKRIRRHVMINGVIPRVHGNMRKKPHNALSLDLYKFAEHFVKNELMRHKPMDMHKGNLVINEPRINLYQQFRTECIPQGKTMSYSTFRHFLKKQFPHVRFVLNRSDSGYGARDKTIRFAKRKKLHPKSTDIKAAEHRFLNDELVDGGDADVGVEDEYLDEYDTETVSDAEPIEMDGNVCPELNGTEIDSFDDSEEMNEADDILIEEIYEDVDFLESENE